jgi:hypothetical protein
VDGASAPSLPGAPSAVSASFYPFLPNALRRGTALANEPAHAAGSVILQATIRQSRIDSPRDVAYNRTMKPTLTLVVAVIVTLLFNIEWEWRPSESTTISLGGPPGGIVACAIVCLVLIYRSFLAIQDLLIARRYLDARVTTPLDLLPWIVLLPLAVTYIARGENWVFKWGEHEFRLIYFLAILITVFVLQVYTVISRIVMHTKAGD